MVFESIDSTNDFLLSQQISPPCVAIAEHQTCGRGRRSRNWQTPKGGSIALSMSWQFDSKTDLRGLSIAVGVMVLRALELPIQLKWPNDILVDDRKLAGILIDVQHQVNSIDAIIGIGINTQLPVCIDNAIDLYEITGRMINHNQLCANLIKQLQSGCNDFSINGLKPFLEQWHDHDALAGQKITVQESGKILAGDYQGITNHGELLLARGQDITILHSGSVNLIRTV